MKKLMLTMLAIVSLQEMPIHGAYYATAAMGAFKAYAPKIAFGLGLSAAGYYADNQAKQFATHADLKVTNLASNLQDQFKQSADQANAHLDGGIKAVKDQLVETNKHIQVGLETANKAAKAANDAVIVANNAVEVGAFGVNALNQKANQAGDLGKAALIAAIANPKLHHILAAYLNPALYEVLGIPAPIPLKWYERLWKGACDITVKTVNDTAMHIFSQIISNFMIGTVNRIVQSPQQPQLQTAPERSTRAAIEENEQEQSQQPARYRAAIRRRR